MKESLKVAEEKPDPLRWGEDLEEVETGLPERDRAVLELLSETPSVLVGFQGLKRLSGLHPEQLTRVLRRLEREGLVIRTELGYRASAQARALFSPAPPSLDRPGVTVLRTYLPSLPDLRRLVKRLKGSWIGPLRWHGLEETPEGLRLIWTYEQGALQMEATFRPEGLTITANTDPSQGIGEAVRLGHLLFQHILEEVDGTPPSLDSA